MQLVQLLGHIALVGELHRVPGDTLDEFRGEVGLQQVFSYLKVSQALAKEAVVGMMKVHKLDSNAILLKIPAYGLLLPCCSLKKRME